MQLRRRRTRLTAALGALTANLLAATVAHAQDSATNSDQDGAQGLDTGSDVGSGLTRVDSAILFYQESGGRVRAVEPVVGATLNDDGGDVLSLRYTADTLTGATPNGATPWTAPQTFTTPAHAPSTTTTVTRASGGALIVTVPGVGTVVRQYTTPANQLPVDPGFRDQRHAIDLNYSTPLTSTLRGSIGGGWSQERDYRSYSFNVGASQDFNHHNTTLSALINFESDQSSPIFGAPAPFTVMNGDVKGGSRSKTVMSVVLGVTQAMSRRWLLQLNYDYGASNGYQTDPYRIISVIDGSSGAPLQYLYESRPDSRIRQSFYLGNKIALLGTFADISARAYHDSWGINSITLEAGDRIPLFSNFYIEPSYRYYRQSKADFFRDYLVGGQPLPSFASSDSRLDAFKATTAGLQLGYNFGPSDIYLEWEGYSQKADRRPDAPGALAGENLFSGVRANSVMIGLSIAFR